MSFYGSTSGYEEQRDDHDDDLDPEYNQPKTKTTTLPPSTAIKEPSTTKVVLDSFAISEPQQGGGESLICRAYLKLTGRFHVIY